MKPLAALLVCCAIGFLTVLGFTAGRESRVPKPTPKAIPRMVSETDHGCPELAAYDADIQACVWVMTMPCSTQPTMIRVLVDYNEKGPFKVADLWIPRCGD